MDAHDAARSSRSPSHARAAGTGQPAPIHVSRLAPTELLHTTPVTHDYAVISFCVAGESRVEQQGTWTQARGDVLLVPAGQAHRTVELRGPELWGLCFCVPCFVAADAGGDAAALLEPFERVRGGASAVVRIPPERQPFLESLFRELHDATELHDGAPGPSHAAMTRSLLTLILGEVGRAATWPDRVPRSGDVVSESLRFIERNCLGPLTLDDVAAAVNRSPSYVTTALRRATGRTAVAWIIAGRMAEARRRLLHSDENVDVIAERVGYSDATHFIRMFRRAHDGATPAAWRARHGRSR